MVSTRPVFLLGPSRCGNTLMQEALNNHANIHISSETHWFDDERCQRHTPIATEEDKSQAQDWFVSLSHKPYGHGGDVEQGWLNRDDLEQKAQQLVKLKDTVSATRDHYFEAYCTLDAQRHGKARWGEKTPRHVFRIDDIVRAFPNAKIICSVRDPRAMVTSYRQWSRRTSHDLYADQADQYLLKEKKRSRDSYHPAIASLLWRGAVRAALNARDSYGEQTIKIVQYEKLVLNAETYLTELADWLSVPYDRNMLKVPLLNSSFDDYKPGAGFNSHAIDRWKSELNSKEVAVVSLLCRKEMEHFNYSRSQQSLPAQVMNSAISLLQLPWAITRAWRANKDRTGNIFSYIWRRLT